MPTFKGFSTIGQSKKFGLTDFELIKRDLLNSFLIRQGQVPGRPEVGTKIWEFVFEPLDDIVREDIAAEIRRLIGLDLRVGLNQLTVLSNENTVVVEVEVTFLADTSVERLSLIFDEQSGGLSLGS